MDDRTRIAQELEHELIRTEPSVVAVIDHLISYSFLSQASDIHIDSTKDGLTVRIRIDGELERFCSIPPALQSGVMTRIKVLANLRTDEHTLPQDGRFTSTHSDTNSDIPPINIRVSIVPTHHGETAVLRLLVPRHKRSFESLGFSVQQITEIGRATSASHGLFLITGPTGSGKTSTLYASMESMNSPSASLVTIEDPVEYPLDGINQIHARQSGFTFADGLRSILRQDPDIIGVGEIRDKETAALAVHASLTGHLVIATLHSNSATVAIPRLITMGIEPYLLASSLKLVLHQRLVPRLCNACRKRTALPKDQKEFFAKAITQEYLRPKFRYISPGCELCKHTGREGRIVLAEFIPFSESDRKHILSQDSAKIDSLSSQPLWIDALQKAAHGFISIEHCLQFLTDV